MPAPKTDEIAYVAIPPKQLAESEIEVARMIRVWVECYIEFPTSDNFDGMCARMLEYQTSWQCYTLHT